MIFKLSFEINFVQIKIFPLVEVFTAKRKRNKISLIIGLYYRFYYK